MTGDSLRGASSRRKMGDTLSDEMSSYVFKLITLLSPRYRMSQLTQMSSPSSNA